MSSDKNPSGGSPALIVHGGAGAIGLRKDRPHRRRTMMLAVARGAAILRRGGSALDAAVASVLVLEDDPLFNAGFGSLLNAAGKVEMDASVMTAAREHLNGDLSVKAGACAVVSRVRNPVLLARAVMERTPHVMMAGAGAERLARRAGLEMCRPEELVSQRARERWRARIAAEREKAARETAPAHGTVGATAIDTRGNLAAATSTGGFPGKLAGRIGDSAIIGAGTFASHLGAASATGHGEAIILTQLCRHLVEMLATSDSGTAARKSIVEVIAPLKSEAGVVVVDARGRIGYAHNAQSMEVGIFDADGSRHLWTDPIGGFVGK